MMNLGFSAERRSTTDGDMDDLDRAADIPLGPTRTRHRAPRPRTSSSSLGSSVYPSTTTSRREGTSRLANISDEDAVTPTGDRISTWLQGGSSTRAIPTSYRTMSEARGPSAATSSRLSQRGIDEASHRRGDRSDAMSARALSSSSRLLRSNASVSARTEALSDTKSHDRIAQWREQQARASEGKEGKPSVAPTDVRRPLATRDDAAGTETPLRSVLRALAQEEMAHSTWALGYAAAVLLRCLLALGSWSGRGRPPMYGDFEAQRHWMELTLHLPVRRWYRYDVQYWGLDYPPLTAWVSLACGFVGSLFPAVHPALALRTSRGEERAALVLFMRWSVLLLDMLLYLPAVAWFLSRRLHTRSMRVRHIALLTVWLQPALLLIDHGHFQYNGVMLGLATLSFACLLSNLPNVRTGYSADAEATAALQRLVLDTLSRHVSLQYVAAAVFFTLSLCFKQMALYYAPAIFAVMLGRCVGLMQRHILRGLALFLALGSVTLAVTAILLAPWLGSMDDVRQVVHRVFPLARGLFEDKVANVWCAISVLPLGARWKLHRMLSVTTLAKLSLGTVLLAILPSCVLLCMASVETVRRESMADDAQAAQVVADVRRRAGSVASGISHRIPPSVREGYATSQGGASHAESAHESSRGSDRRSMTGSSILGGSTSTWMQDGSSARRPRPAILPSSHKRPSATPSPAAELLPYTLASTSLAFFLFGFQTHEKSILLPLLPLTLLMTAKGDRTGAGAAATDWEWGVLANNVGLFSMWPLLQRDGQAMAWWLLLLGWNALIGYRPWEALHTTRASFVAWLAAATYAAMLGLLALEYLLPSMPWALLTRLLQRYPDLFPVLNVLLCVPVLGLLWLWTLKKQVQIALASGLWSISSSSSSNRKAAART